MNLLDRLHCPECQGRLAARPTAMLQCSNCHRTTRIIDGIVDFAADNPPATTDPHCYRGNLEHDDPRSVALMSQIRTAAGDRWPAALGDILELGCGRGQATRALAAAHPFRSMLVLDSSIEMARIARGRLAALGIAGERPALFVTLGVDRNAIRDAIADTVVGIALFSGVADPRGFLGMVHRVLKPGGRALFVVPNQHYRRALSQATAEALVQRFARDGVWPEGNTAILDLLAHTRCLLVHSGDMTLVADQAEKQLFDSATLEDLGREVGFATAAMVPLDPDPAGAVTARCWYTDAGVSDHAARELAPLAASAGQPFFSLLNRQDQSSAMLFWLTKASGPEVRIFAARPPPLPVGHAAPEAALGGAPPRWSIELRSRDTSDGIVVTVGGWCLVNVDVLWLRLTIGGLDRVAPVCRPRPDVHEVLNRNHGYHPMNVLCSGMDSTLVFGGVHAVGNACPFSLEIQLSNGVVISGPMPERLVMGEQVVIAH